MKLRKLFYCLFVFVTVQALAAAPQSWSKESVFVFPEAGRQPWIEAIRGANNTIDIAAYKLSDPVIIKELKEAAQKGIVINLLIEGSAFKHEKSANVKSPLEELMMQKIHVHSPQSKRFNQYHYKTVIVDKEWGLISTGNLDAESFDGLKEPLTPAARDFAVPVLDKKLASDVLKVFLADTQEQRIVPKEKPLVWGPDYQRSTFLALLNGAEKTIDIYQQDFQDVGMAQAVAAAAKAGVKVRVLMMPFPFNKSEDKNIPNQNLMKEAGASIGLFEALYVHAKIVIVDDKVMYVGSGNFYTASIDQTRELGIMIKNTAQIKALKAVFEKDWQRSEINQDR
jgi:phosphatidylserine/phosphatidylglycerophosphate/cardiolipin synthase-like enzyme